MSKKMVVFCRSFIGIIVFLFACLGANAQTTYFTRASTAWNLPTTWSTVGYGGVPAITVPVAGDIVNIGNGNTVTVGAAAACATLTIDNGAILNLNNTITVSSTTTVNGTLSTNSTAGTKTFSGLITIGVGGTWNETVNEAFTFQGGITNNGTFTAGTGVHTFNTNSQVLTGTLTIPSVTVTGGTVVLTNTNSLTVNTALGGTGRITQGAGATLNIGGSSGITNMTATAGGNTVNYTGTGQTIHNNAYVNLGMSGSGVKNLQAGITSITGNLTLGGSASATAVAALTIGGNVTLGNGTSFTAGAFTHNVAGDWINNGSTFTGTGSVINLNGAAQNIGGSATTTFDDLQLSGSGTKTFTVNTTISDELSIDSGVIAGLSNINTHSANTLILAGALQGTGTWGSTASSPAAANQNDTFFSGNGLITVNSGGFTFYSIASSDWSLTSTWSTIGFGGAAASTTPGAGDYVVIGDGQSVTITDDETCEVLLFDASTAQTNSLIINSGSLTVATDITIPQTVTSGSNILSVVSGSLLTENVNFTASGGGAGHQLTISTGTVSINGDITGIGASSTIQFTGAGLLEVGGSMFSSANGTLTSVAGSTVAYTGAAQTVQALSYNNLTLSGSGTKTLAGTTAVGGNLAISDGVTFTIGAFTFSVAGTTTVGGGTSGTLSITSATGTKTFTGLVTVATGGSWTNTTEAVTFQGGITNNGTFTAGTGVHTFNTNSQALTGTFTFTSVTVTGGAVVLTNTNSLTVNTALSGSGRITQGTGATLNIGGASAITNMTAIASGNTVNYTGAAQTVKNVNYENLGLSGSDVKTLQVGTTAITGDLILSGTVTTTGVIGLTIGGTVDIGSGTTFTAGAFTHIVGGDWINDGTFTGAGSVINFNGAAQSITGGSTTFNDLILSGSGTKTLSVSTTASGILSIANGVVANLNNANSYTSNSLILGNAIQQSGTWGSTSSAATNQNDTFFSGNGLITVVTGGNTYYSIASTAWNVNTTWSNAGFGGPAATGTPGPDDFVYIGDSFTVTVTSPESCSALFFDAGTSVTNTLAINSGGSLTVSGVVTIPQTVTSGSNILSVGAGTLTASRIDFTASGGGAGHQLTISTGTVSINGDITGIGASSTIQFTGAGLLEVGGSMFSSANGTLTSVAGSTVAYTGAAQTVQALGYNNLTLSGSGTKTLAGTTALGGNLAISDGVTFTIGAFTFSVAGTTTVGTGTSGTLSITSATGTKTFTGLVTVATGGTWTNTTEAVTFQGGITNNGTFTAGTGVHTFNTNSQALTGTFTFTSVTVTGAAVVLTNTNSLTVNTALSGTGRITQGTGATLNIGGASAITNMTATASGNTVNYTGAAQTVKNVNYANLGLSGSGVKTLQVGTTAITGDLTLSGTVTTTGVIGLTIGGTVDIGSGTTFTSGAFTHTVGGDWINNGTFTGTGSVINFNGAAQSLTGGAITFNDLILSGSGVKTFGIQVTITNDFFINSVIADLGSVTTHTANRLILDGVLQGTTNQTWGSTASGANVQNNTYFLNPSTGLITIAIGGTNFYSSASADWGVNTTWSNVNFGGPTSAGTPGPTDFVFIGGGFSVSVAGTEVCSAISFDPGTSVANTLTITGSLTVTGDITIPQTITSGQNNLNVGAGNLVADNIAFTAGSPGGTGHRMTISTGTATINGDVTGTGTSSLIIFSGAGLLRLGDSFYTSANGTLTTVAGSTVEYNGTDQIIESHTTYRNLTLSGSGNKTLSASTNTTIGGNLVVGDNTSFNIGASTLVVTGTTTVGGGASGSLSVTSATGTKTFSGLVTIGAGATWTNTTEAVTFQGGITNTGTFTAGTGIHTFNTNSQALTGSFTIPSVTVTGGAVALTNNNSLTVNTALSGTGRITQGTGATLNIGGASGITNMTATASGNTVNYTGAVQTVNNVNFENLGLSGSGAKTLQVGTTSITGNLTLSGTASTSGVIGLSIGGIVDIGSGTTFTAGAFTHTIGGNFINNGTFNTGSGTIAFVGAAPQTISGASLTNFNNITISNTSGVSVESNQNLIGVLSLAASTQFDADGGSNTAVFTLLSSGDSPTQDASIATLPAGASVIGDVTVQRYMEIEGASGGRIYRYVSSPVQSAPVSQIQTEIPVTGSFTGTSICAGCGSTQSMFLYNESVITDTNGSGGNNFDDGFEDFPSTSNSEILTTGRGYALFVRGNIDPVLSSGSARWDVRGPINSGTIDYTPFTTFTSSGNVANDGWNLVGNPYPSTIDWDAATGWTRSNINNAIYVRDNGLVSPVYASYVGGVGTNGGSRFIAIGQAFYVKSDGGAINFQSNEDVKVAGTQTTFIREGGVSDIIRVSLNKDGNKDETVIRFSKNASNGFDKDMDAIKLANAIFNLSSVSGNIKYAINSVPENSCSTTIQLNIANASVGNYELNFSDLSTFSNTPLVSLLDGFTGQAIAITDNMKYNFSVTSDVNSSGNRFSIIVEQPALNLLINAQGADKICIDSPYTIALATSETGVKYFASIDGNTVSEPANGNGSELILNVPSDKLGLGENTLTLYAQRTGCTALPLSSVINVTVDRIYEVLSVTDGLSCQAGQSTLKADGAPANGKYRWYQSINSSELISETSNGEFITPVLDKTKSYYVSVVNAAGCEGNRHEVKAVVEQFENAEITETSYGVLTSSHSSGNRWYYNNELISGAIGQSITVAESGLYRVEVVIGACKSTDEFEFVVTGIEADKIQARAYPNPVVDKLIVQVTGLGVSSIEIISNSGIPVGRIQVKKNTNDVEIDFADKPAGLYLVKLNSDRSAVSTFKIIKK
jgi:hypothetical protein